MSLPPAIEKFLSAFLGLDADAAGRGALGRTVAAIMHQEGITDPGVYEKLCLSSPDARQRLIDAVTVGETWFFRDRGPFIHLGRHARDFRGNGLLKILSAPCASGEEPYSIAMMLLAEGFAPAAFRVDGVDVSAVMLDKARGACYGRGSVRGHLPAHAAPYFRETAHGWQVAGEVVRQVNFYRENLVEPASLAGRGPYDMIFCRNLLIYLTADARRLVFKKLDDLLRPGGLLFTGHTETTFWHQQGYLPLAWERAFALAKPCVQPPVKAGPVKFSASARPVNSAKNCSTGAGPQADVPTAGGNKFEHALPAPAAAKADASETCPLQQARQLADKGDTDEALRLCRKRLRTAGPNAEIYCLMGVLQMSRKNLTGAEDYFIKALYLDPGHYESLVHLSLICRQKGDQRKALLYRERAQRLVPDDKKSRKTGRPNG